jgi:hypothetical protein
MSLTLTHTLHDHIEVSHNARLLFRYNYAPSYDPWEARKPFMHPINTLAGNEITCYRPHDHVWHKGIQMTMANLSGQNFWGGFSYVRDQGYVKLDNVGRMEHRGWDEINCDGSLVVLREKLKWITAAGAEWIAETREIRVAEVNEAGGYWSLDWKLVLKNVSDRALIFGSPTTEGRANAGYGGLFWRGPRSFTGGKLLGPGTLEGPESMGQRAPWLAFVGTHDGTADQSTVLFIDRPGNPDYPNKWFARSKEFACMSFSFSFDRELELAAGKELTLNYRTLFASGGWSREKIEQYIAANQR